jgi:hypothetical protein
VSALVIILKKLPMQKRGWRDFELPSNGAGGVPPPAAGSGSVVGPTCGVHILVLENCVLDSI